MFRKVIGDPPVPMIAFAFTIIGLINLTLCWPIPLGLYLSGTEVMPLESLFWIDLLIACILMLSMFSLFSPFTNYIHVVASILIAFANLFYFFRFMCVWMCKITHDFGSFPYFDTIQCCSYLQHVCHTRIDNKRSSFSGYTL